MTSSRSDIAAPAPATAALMNSIYRRQRHIYDATRKFYLLGRDHLIADLRPPQGGSVLEIGCGTGRNLIAAARRYPYARFYGFDISTAMLETAAVNIAKAELPNPIQIGEADAASFDGRAVFGVPVFDRVVFSYTLSMIPPWRQAIATGLAHLKPGGSVHIVDFGQQENLPAPFKALLFAWLKKFHVSPRETLFQELDTATATGDFSIATRPLYRGYAWYADVKRKA